MSTEDRLKALREAQPDSWVALSADESCVVAYGKTYQTTVEKAAELGERDPILIRTLHRWRAMVANVEDR